MESSDELVYVRRKLWRILWLASNGFYRTMGNEEKINNRFFLEIIKESYKALTAVKQMNQWFSKETGGASAGD